MPKKISACLSAFLILVMLAFAYGEANAARIGGGRSFGGRPSMSQPFTKPTPPVNSQSMRQQTGSVVCLEAWAACWAVCWQAA